MGVCLAEILYGSSGITMCGSCFERFDSRSIFNKLARYRNFLSHRSETNCLGLLRTVARHIDFRNGFPPAGYSMVKTTEEASDGCGSGKSCDFLPEGSSMVETI